MFFARLLNGMYERMQWLSLVIAIVKSVRVRNVNKNFMKTSAVNAASPIQLNVSL